MRKNSGRGAHIEEQRGLYPVTRLLIGHTPYPRPASSHGIDDLLDALHALRSLWLPSFVLSLAAGAGLALVAWG